MFEGENHREKILVLLTMCFALFMAMLDNTVVNVALPTLSRDLGADVGGLQWIVDGYVLAFASLLLTGGILGDRYGRKRMFLLGLGIFTVASLLCGLSGSTSQLIAARALQGIGAALLMPGTLSIISVTFPPHERAKAIGFWAGVSGLALALGPTLGGWMIENVGWESVFFLNVPIGIAGLIVGWRVVKESRAEQARRLDFGGLGFGTAGLFALTFALIEANERGWTDPLIVATLVAGVGLLGAFVAWERRTDHAMLPLSFFRIPAFSAGNAVAFAVTLGMFGIFFFLSLYMQVIRGYSPLQTGVRFLPMTVMIIVTAPNAGRFASKHGSRGIMTFGLSLAGAGMLMLSGISVDTPFGLMLPVFMLMGVGMASVMSPMTAAVMNAVGAERAGLGSATTNTSREVGGVFGIALLGTLLTTKLKASMTVAIAGIGISGAQSGAIVEAASHGRIDPSILAGLTPEQMGAVQGAFADSFMDGFRLALMLASLVLLTAAVVANRFIPS
ncbi:MAG: DHA2 family efflux MFS transporter permease subunit, partial [Actinomycetota bacterium]